MANTTATERVFNFSAGPAVLPEPVLEQVRDEMLCLPGAGCSVLEISHRSKIFAEILNSTRDRIKRLFNIGDDYDVLFLQGGSRLQFSMIPMNVVGAGQSADYLVTGTWSKKAAAEAANSCTANVIWDGKPDNFDRLPESGDIHRSADSAYLYYASNETIQGVQFPGLPTDDGYKDFVCDASSDMLSRPVDVNSHAILYACAQKNAGPAGVTVVIIRRDLLDRAPAKMPTYLNYKIHSENDSCYNTPPTFAVYVTGLVAKWIEDSFGSLESIERHNREKAALLYDVVDEHSDFYIGHAHKNCRSQMNVTFKFANADLDSSFKEQAAKENLHSLGGHRSVGGIRASIYNAMPMEGVKTLAEFMKDFAQKNA
jgi:phosphoserine aminotransferase